MIDIEAQVYRAVLSSVTPVLSTLGIAHPGKHVVNDYVKQPPVFPHVSVVEINNVTDASRQSSSSDEKFSILTYEVNVYSNKQIGRKAECKVLADAVDKTLLQLGFTRKSLEPFPNFMDATVFRMVGRYTVLVSEDETLYRR